MLRFAQALVAAVAELRAASGSGDGSDGCAASGLLVRVGMHTGRVVAGVVGTRPVRSLVRFLCTNI